MHRKSHMPSRILATRCYGIGAHRESTTVPSLSSTDVGKIVPAVKTEDDAGSEVSEWELRERQEREECRRVEELDAGGDGWGGSAVTAQSLLHGIGRRGIGGGYVFLLFFPFYFSFVISLVRCFSFLGQAWVEGKGSSQRAALRGR